MNRSPSHHLLLPTISTGILMAAYLVVRPYGDAGTPAETAAAYASTAWVVSHVCGLLAVASIGRLGLRIADLLDGVPARLARWGGLTGAMLTVTYYGAETFGLHAVGQHALIDPSALEMTDAIRFQPAAVTIFGLGLLLLVVAGICVGLAWSRRVRGAWGRAVWPLAIAIALVPAQYFLPPVGRIVFGVLYLAAAVIFAVALLRTTSSLPHEIVRSEVRSGAHSPIST